MENIGFVSQDQGVKMMLKQLKDHNENLNFYEIDDALTVIDQYAITHIIFDFNNFKTLEDSLLYQRLNQRSRIRFLIIGNEISELLHNELQSNNVIAHLQKPMSFECFYEAVRKHLFHQTSMQNSDGQGISQLSNRFHSCLHGYYFLNKAVQYCHENHVDKSVRMAVIYDHIAVNYQTTKSDVEKSIRKLIATFKHERHWTNSETILYYYEKLHAKQLELHQ